MSNHVTTRDLANALDEAKAKASNVIETARDSAGRAGDAATSVVSAALSDGADKARTDADTFGKAAQDVADTYRSKLANADPVSNARDLGENVKALTSDALSGLGKVVADNAALAQEKLGEKYGDAARSAARSIQETAAKLETGDLADLGDAIARFVRKNPALTLSVAAVVGYLAYRRMKKTPAPDAAKAA